VKSDNAGDVYGWCHTPTTSLNRVDVRKCCGWVMLGAGWKRMGKPLAIRFKGRKYGRQRRPR